VTKRKKNTYSPSNYFYCKCSSVDW